MILENQCLLAHKCKNRGQDEKCNYTCYPHKKLHGNQEGGGMLVFAEVPKSYSKSLSNNLPFQGANPMAYQIITHYCSDVVAQVDEGKGLYLYSMPNTTNQLGTGTGKTTAATAILNEYVLARVILAAKQQRNLYEIPAIFVNVSSFQNTFNKQFRGPREITEKASRRYYTLKERMIAVDLLVLDDIGVRESTPAFTGEFYEVIEERVSSEKATIYTSNVPIARIEQIFDGRTASRIEGSTLAVTFKGTDKRREGGDKLCLTYI